MQYSHLSSRVLQLLSLRMPDFTSHLTSSFFFCDIFVTLSDATFAVFLNFNSTYVKISMNRTIFSSLQSNLPHYPSFPFAMINDVSSSMSRSSLRYTSTSHRHTSATLSTCMAKPKTFLPTPPLPFSPHLQV